MPTNKHKREDTNSKTYTGPDTYSMYLTLPHAPIFNYLKGFLLLFQAGQMDFQLFFAETLRDQTYEFPVIPFSFVFSCSLCAATELHVNIFQTPSGL